MKQVMVQQTPGRYMLKAMMAGFLLSIVTVFMFGIKTQFASTHRWSYQFNGSHCV